MAEATRDAPGPGKVTKADYEAIAAFRHQLRDFIRFSEDLARVHGITPQQHQLLLAIKGFPGRDWATIRELAGRLALRHHSVVGEIDRAERSGLVARAPHPEDRRAVEVRLTAQGDRLLDALTLAHQQELARAYRGLWPGLAATRPRGPLPLPAAQAPEARRAAAKAGLRVALVHVHEAAPLGALGVLVDRSRPRGAGSSLPSWHVWAKELAPSAALRTWLRAHPGAGDEFRRRYRQELRLPDRQRALERLRELGSERIALVTAVKDVAQSHLPTLRDALIAAPPD